MSDLFQRLAHQAKGQGLPSVRAAARVRAEPVGVAARGERDAAPSLELEQVATVPYELGGSIPDQERTGNSVMPASVMAAGRVANAAETPTGSPTAVRNEPPMPLHGPPRRAEPRLPAPLLDWQRASTAPSTQPVARVELGASTTEVEPTEVHVHIGRIEITAEKAPPLRSKPAATRQPMALGDYLAKRQRRTP
jgi:hypothetical protein